MNYTAAASSNIGRVRNNNEDNFFFDGVCLFAEENIDSTVLSTDVFSENMAFGVFDGMGGESCGEKASEIAATEFRRHFTSVSQSADERLVNRKLNRFYKAAQKSVRKLGRKNKSLSGTTAAVLILLNDLAVISNIGDSRVYRIRSGQIEQLSEDHTLAGMMVRAGKMTAEESKKSRGAHSLTRFIGSPSDDYDFLPFVSSAIRVEQDDWYLLCSDGLTDMLSDNEIAMTICNPEYRGCEKIVTALTETALERGGKDNCTIILAHAE